MYLSLMLTAEDHTQCWGDTPSPLGHISSWEEPTENREDDGRRKKRATKGGKGREISWCIIDRQYDAFSLCQASPVIRAGRLYKILDYLVSCGSCCDGMIISSYVFAKLCGVYIVHVLAQRPSWHPIWCVDYHWNTGHCNPTGSLHIGTRAKTISSFNYWFIC